MGVEQHQPRINHPARQWQHFPPPPRIRDENTSFLERSLIREKAKARCRIRDSFLGHVSRRKEGVSVILIQEGDVDIVGAIPPCSPDGLPFVLPSLLIPGNPPAASLRRASPSPSGPQGPDNASIRGVGEQPYALRISAIARSPSPLPTFGISLSPPRSPFSLLRRGEARVPLAGRRSLIVDVVSRWCRFGMELERGGRGSIEGSTR